MQITVKALALLLLLIPARGWSWGDEGHEIVGLIADHYLKPGVRAHVAAILQGDASGLTPTTDLADETTWADKFRDADRDGTQLNYRHTGPWHYVNIEIDAPDLDAACYGHPPSPAGAASSGPAEDCILDKIDEFRRELEAPATTPDERRLALQFLLHLVGDLHQPLHVTDHHDRGGNGVRVHGAGTAPGNLHHYWDTVFVERLGRNPDEVAARLSRDITDAERQAWSAGSPKDWTLETYEIGKRDVYSALPATGELDPAYVARATQVVALQLQRAGLRLALVLNEALP
jgi:hypothetical protein